MDTGEEHKCHRLGMLLGLIFSGEVVDTMMDCVVKEFDEPSTTIIANAMMSFGDKKRPAISPLQYFASIDKNDQDYEK